MFSGYRERYGTIARNVSTLHECLVVLLVDHRRSSGLYHARLPTVQLSHKIVLLLFQHSYLVALLTYFLQKKKIYNCQSTESLKNYISIETFSSYLG